jgi:hypothetical protein
VSAAEAPKPSSARGTTSRNWRDDMRPLSPLSDKGHDRGSWSGSYRGGWRGGRGSNRSRGRGGPRHHRLPGHAAANQPFEVGVPYAYEGGFASGDPPFFVPPFLSVYQYGCSCCRSGGCHRHHSHTHGRLPVLCAS